MQWHVFLPSEEKPGITLTQDPEYKVMFPGESVSFSCHVNDSFGWTYKWYKDKNQLIASGSKYSLNSVNTSNRGAYACQAKRGMGQAFLTDFSQTLRLEVEGTLQSTFIADWSDDLGTV